MYDIRTPHPKEEIGESDQSGSQLHRVRVWDLPTRVFHWTLVLLVGVSVVTVRIGATWMDCHAICGASIMALILFRIAWGFIGGRESRFASFMRGPATVIRYAKTLHRQSSMRYLGHNPMGGWSVLLMLFSLFFQAATGLFANDDILTEGPLFHLVGKSASDSLTTLHRLNSSVFIALVFLHVCAVLFYLVYKKDNLVTPMFSGFKSWPRKIDADDDNVWMAVAVTALLALGVYGIFGLS